jgi:hypothetical protein
MLWFLVDIPHGQRYFFICGCKQTVKKKGAIRAIPEFRCSFERLAGTRGFEMQPGGRHKGKGDEEDAGSAGSRSIALRNAAFLSPFYVRFQ